MKKLPIAVISLFILLLAFQYNGQAQDGNYVNLTAENLFITGPRSSAVPPVEIRHTTTDQSFYIRSLNSNQGLYGGGIGFSSDSAFYPFWVFETAKTQSLSIREEGVGIGSYQSNAPLHVYADGTPFAEAHILIENDLSTADRTLLTLKNKGGSKIFLENTLSQQNWVFGTDGTDVFEIGMEGEDNGLFYVRGEMEVLSDQNAKDIIEATNGLEVLEKTQELPLYTFQFKNSRNSALHLGPMAQDFQRLFQLGNSEKSISPMDGLGVALAAIQGVNIKLKEKDQEIEWLKLQLASLTQVVNDLKSMINQ